MSTPGFEGFQPPRKPLWDTVGAQSLTAARNVWSRSPTIRTYSSALRQLTATGNIGVPGLSCQATRQASTAPEFAVYTLYVFVYRPSSHLDRTVPYHRASTVPRPYLQEGAEQVAERLPLDRRQCDRLLLGSLYLVGVIHVYMSIPSV